MSTKVYIPEEEVKVVELDYTREKSVKTKLDSEGQSWLLSLSNSLRAYKNAMGSRTKLFVCCLGIFICYFYYGILQEKITRSHYGHGESQEKFTYTISLVFIQCVINAGFARILVHVSQRGGGGGGLRSDRTPTTLYAACSLSYLLAMLSSNHALQHVNYPTQVVGKSCKPIPVMILGVLLAGKRYALQKYAFVLMIVAGVSLFMYKDVKKSEHVYDEHVVGIGEALLIFSLSMDGVTGAIQEQMRSLQTSSGHTQQGNVMMYEMNKWSTLYLAIGEVLSGEVFDFMSFVSRFPLVLFNIVTFGLASALGQYFIFMTVSEFGPLVCSILTTTRKFFTVLASVFLFGNTLLSRQWLGTALVFTGLALDALYGKSSARKVDKTAKDDSLINNPSHRHHHRSGTAAVGHHDKHHHSHHHPRHHPDGGGAGDIVQAEVESILRDIGGQVMTGNIAGPFF